MEEVQIHAQEVQKDLQDMYNPWYFCQPLQSVHFELTPVITSDIWICFILERRSDKSVSESDSSDSAGSDSDHSTATKGIFSRNLKYSKDLWNASKAKSEPLIFQTGTVKTNQHV